MFHHLPGSRYSNTCCGHVAVSTKGTSMLNKSIRGAAAIGLIVGGALFSASTSAGVTAHVVTEAEINSHGDIGTAGDLKTCPGCEASISSTGTVPSATFGTSHSDSTARATAQYGVLKAFATAASNGHFAQARATATASFSDSFTINAVGLSGEKGTAVIPLQFNYTNSLSGPQAFSQVSLSLELFNTFPTAKYQRSLHYRPDGTVLSDSFDPPHVVTPFSTSILATVPFVFGQPVPFQVTLEGKGGGFEDESFTVDAAHSAFWGGFRSVTDASGSAVNYTLGGGSQADWSKSFIPTTVPEPDTFALMMGGLFAIGSLLASTRHHKRPSVG
jgi:hypothetical protein